MKKNKTTALIRGIVFLFSPNRHEGSSCFLKVVIFLIIIFILDSPYINCNQSYYYPVSSNAKKRNCYSNIEMIQSACKMYAMDHVDFLSEIDMPLLIKEGYLKSEPTCPESGSYRLLQGDYEKGDIIVKCSVHGTIEPSAKQTIINKSKKKIKRKSVY